MQAPMTTQGAASPFFWGSNGQQLSPAQIAAQQQIAAAMMTRQQAPQNVGEGLNSIGQALLAKSLMDRASAAQSSGTQSAADAFAGIGDDPSLGALETAAGNPFLNEGQSSVLKAMLQQKLQQSDPKYQADLGLTNAQTVALEAKPVAPPVVVPRGSSVIDPVTHQPVFTPPDTTGGFDGTSDTATDLRILMTGDPASKEYAIAYQREYGPKTQQQQTPTGLVTFQIQNPPPSGMVPPTFGAAPAAPSAGSTPAFALPAAAPQNGGAAPAMSPTAAAVTDMTAAPQVFSPSAPPVEAGPANVVPGNAPYNESQSRLNYLAQSATPDLQRVITGFPALTQVIGQLADKDPTGLTNGAKSPEYQQASIAVRSAMGNIMYFVSGAAQGNVEVERKLGSYMPAFGDKPATVADKLSRFSNDVVAMARAGKDPATLAWAQQAVAGLQGTIAQIDPNSAAPKQINNNAEYDALPSGTTFTGPDGTTRKKP